MSSRHSNLSAGSCFPTTRMIESSFDSATPQKDQLFVPSTTIPAPQGLPHYVHPKNRRYQPQARLMAPLPQQVMHHFWLLYIMAFRVWL